MVNARRARSAAPGAAPPTPRFPGFQAGAPAVALPRELFVALLPRIEEEGELRATLYALAAAVRPGPVLGVRRSQLLRERPLLRQFERLAPGEAESAAGAALSRVADRGSMLAVELPDGDLLYLMNSPAGRRQRDRLLAGALTPPPAPSGWRAGAGVAAGPEHPADPAGAVAVYEPEIGLITPAVAAALAEAEARYPEGWIEDALRLAALHNARSWAYAEAVLRRWEVEGRGEEGTDAGAERDPGGDPYRRVVRRSWP
ncbi:MAG: hypothetical protein F4150_08720 [Chloroflexi bacterium]|nr:hypothetical protein [Chloroflexota bacterium]